MTPRLGRFRGRADIEPQRKPAELLENDPEQTSAPRTNRAKGPLLEPNGLYGL
jgi:hypothetical protein